MKPHDLILETDEEYLARISGAYAGALNDVGMGKPQTVKPAQFDLGAEVKKETALWKHDRERFEAGDNRKPYELLRDLKAIAARALVLAKHGRAMQDFAHDLYTAVDTGQVAVEEE